MVSMQRMAKEWGFLQRFAAAAAALLSGLIFCGCGVAEAGTPSSTMALIKPSHTVEAQVQTASQPPSGSPMAVQALSPTTAVALVMHGTSAQLVVTTNGGRDWSRRAGHFVAGYPDPAMDFVTRSTGFVLDNATLWKTSNGGNSWQTLNHRGFTAVSFATPTQGLAIQQNGAVLWSRDGGLHWTTGLQEQGLTMTGVDWVNPELAYASGVTQSGPTVWRSVDGGQSWQVVFSGIQSSALATAYAAYNQAMGFTGTLRPTFNTGAHVTFTTPQDGWLDIFDGGFLATAIFRTTDGGAQWSYVWGNGGCAMGCNSMGGGLYPAAYFGPQNVWRFNGRGIDYSTNAGTTWTPGPALPFGGEGASQAVRQVSFATARIGWFAATGAIYGTTDGGRHWTREWPVGPHAAALAAFSAHGYGWLVTQGGSTLWVTTNEGKSWYPLTKNFGTVVALDLWSPRAGLVLSNGGTGWVTNNGGRTWTAWRVPAQFQSGLQQENWIQMLNPRDGWMDAGFALWTTHNGGKRWHKSSSLLMGPFGADFVSPSTGWALSGLKRGKPTTWHYRVMSTADGGRHWITHGTWPMLGTPAEIALANPSRGWIVTPHGLLTTTDGGARWTQIRLPHVQPASVSVSGHVLSLVTMNGRLLMSTDGGMHWGTIING